jgi:hypothetical protein
MWSPTYLHFGQYLVKNGLRRSHEGATTFSLNGIYYLDNEALFIDFNGFEARISHSVKIGISTIRHRADLSWR